MINTNNISGAMSKAGGASGAACAAAAASAAGVAPPEGDAAASLFSQLLAAPATPAAALPAEPAPAEALPAEEDLQLPQALLSLLGLPLTAPATPMVDASGRTADPAADARATPASSAALATNILNLADPAAATSPATTAAPPLQPWQPASVQSSASPEPEARSLLMPEGDSKLVMPDLLSAGQAHAAPADLPGATLERIETLLHRSSAIVESRAPVVTSLPVQATPDQPEWAEEIGQQVIWSARQNLQSAELRLHPRELGNLSVSLQIEQDQARVSFSAAHPAASAALEQALPRLRELFAEQGMTLSQAQVSDASAQQQGDRRAPAQPTRSDTGSATDPGREPAAEATRTQRTGVGLLDDYA